MNIIKDIEQGTAEWLELRKGYITASRFKDVLAKGRNGAPSKTRQSYMYQLAAEIMSGEIEESYTNSYMEWGTEQEPHARELYELSNGLEVEEVTFIKLGDHRIGASPDGLVGDSGGLEIKCPKSSTQIETILKGELPSQYVSQVQGCLWVSGREWWDFVSFDPRIKGKSSYFEKRIYRDDKYIADLEAKVFEFETELMELLEELK